MSSRLTFIIVILLVVSVQAQPKFEIEYQTPSNFNLNYNDAIVTNDEGFLVTGSYGEGSGSDIYLIKLDKFGILQWSYLYDGPSTYDYALSLAETSEGEIVVAGHSNFVGNTHITVLKLDAVGSIIWDNAYYNAGLGTSGPWDMVIDESDNIYITGGGCGQGSIFISQLDNLGQSQWYNTYMNMGGAGMKIEISADHNLIVSGVTQNSNNAAFLKVTQNGNILHGHYYETSENIDSYSNSMIELESGNVLINTVFYFGTGLTTRCALTMVDSLGVLLWQKRYNFNSFPDDNDQSSGMIELENGQILIGSRHQGNNGIDYHRNFFTINQLGSVQGSTTTDGGLFFQAQKLVVNIGATGDLYVLAGGKFPRFLRVDQGLSSFCQPTVEEVADSLLNSFGVEDTSSWQFSVDTSICNFIPSNFPLIMDVICYDSTFVNSTADLSSMTPETNAGYPNPVNDIYYLSSQTIDQSYLVNCYGQLLEEFPVGTIQINTIGLAEGIYYFVTTRKSRSFHSKLIVKH